MSDHLAEILRLNERIAELEAENDALRLEADDLDRQVAELDDELAKLSLDSDVDAERYVAELEQEVDTLFQENAELEAQLVDAETNAAIGARLASDEERVYLASKNRRHFHRPGCKWAAYIPDYLLIEFGSHLEAVQAGYKPCKTCRA